MENFLNNFNFYFRPKNAEELTAKKQYQGVLSSKIYPILAKNSSKPPKKPANLQEIHKQFEESIGLEMSYSTMELKNLLNKPHIKKLFLVADEIVEYSMDNKIPQILQDDSVEGEEIRRKKLVNIVSNRHSLGIALKIDLNGHVFVEDVLAGSPIHSSGCFNKNDRILEINGHSVEQKTDEELEELLNVENGNLISFLLETPPPPNPLLSKYPYFIRTMRDFSPDNNKNTLKMVLSFNRGDILEVLGVGDNNNWLKVGYLRNTTWYDTDLMGCSSEFQKFGQIPASPFSLMYSLTDCNENHQGPVFEEVALIDPSPGIIRCLVFVGPRNVGRNVLKKHLLKKFPKKFAQVVPHTTRKPRKNERNGLDYNFVGRDEMQKDIHANCFIEFGEYNGNLYGTKFESISKIIRAGKMPILNIHEGAIEKLRTSEFLPIVIFVKPPDILVLKQTRSRNFLVENISSINSSKNSAGDYFTDLDFKQMIGSAEQIQKSYGKFFDYVLVNANLPETLEELHWILENFEQRPSFLPLKWVNWV